MKQLVDVGSVGGTHFEKFTANFIGQLFSFKSAHLPVIYKIAFVAN